MTKVNEENERIKRKYLQYRRTAQHKDEETIDKDADAILHFEASTNYAPFKKFRIEQAIHYRDKLDAEKNKKTGNPLAKATIAKRLASIEAFIFWLADQPGYKSRIRYSDADYFNMEKVKGSRTRSEQGRIPVWRWSDTPLIRCLRRPTLSGAIPQSSRFS